MLFPIRDVIPSITTPLVTWTLIGLNIGVHLWWLAAGSDAHASAISSWGLVPAAFSGTSVVTSMFIHADWLHLASNMISLWIFGDNVEDQMGRGRFLLFYVLCGAAGAACQTWAGPSSVIPMVGASGAIAGVMGAYLVLFPGSRVLVLLFLIFYINVIEVPAAVFLALWFLVQVIGSARHAATDAASAGGIAFWAHTGGFLAGVLGAKLLVRRDRTVWTRRD